MRDLKISYGHSANALKWSNRTTTWEALREKLKTTVKTAETMEQYRAMSRPEREAVKDIGGFVGGHLKNGRRLVDRRGAAFPLRRIAQPGGCVVQVLNSAELMPLRKRDRLPETSGWRLLLDADEPVEAVVKVYRAALDGKDFRALPEWASIEGMQTTTGHYFRGVE